MTAIDVAIAASIALFSVGGVIIALRLSGSRKPDQLRLVAIIGLLVLLVALAVPLLLSSAAREITLLLLVVATVVVGGIGLTVRRPDWRWAALALAAAIGMLIAVALIARATGG